MQYPEGVNALQCELRNSCVTGNTFPALIILVS